MSDRFVLVVSIVAAVIATISFAVNVWTYHKVTGKWW